MKRRMDAARLRNGLRQSLWGLLLVLVSFYLAWMALAQMDYGYPLLYEPLGMAHNIETYGPINRVRPDFHLTPREERLRLFAAIGEAIRGDTARLQTLRYHDAQDRELGSLLTAAEILHLEDVSRLVRSFERVGLLALAGWLLMGVWQWRRRWALPSAPRVLAGMGLVLLLAGVVLLSIGPTAVFYWLHEAVFPSGHPWFFYYEESLMSMMMRAPVLFGGIAVLWLLLALLLCALLFVVARRLASSPIFLSTDAPRGRSPVNGSRANSRPVRRSTR